MNGKTPVEVKARGVKKCVISDDWWDKLDYILSLTKPIYEMIMMANRDAIYSLRQ